MTDKKKTVARPGTQAAKTTKAAAGQNTGETADNVPAIQWADPRTLVPNPANPRYIEDADFRKLVRSLRDFPDMLKLRPIIIQDEATRQILGGNMRTRAAIEAGLALVPYINAEFLTDEQRQEFIIKDNVGFGKWDTDKLANEWDINLLADWGVDLVPPTRADKKVAIDDNFAIPSGLTTGIQVGDVIEIGAHRLICGDARDPETWTRLMSGNKAAMVFVDPPLHPDGIMAGMDQIFGEAMAHSQDTATMFCFYPWKTREAFTKATHVTGWQILQELIWNRGLVIGPGNYHQAHDNIFYIKKAGKKVRWFGDRGQKSVLQSSKADLQKLRKEELITILVALKAQSTVWDMDQDRVVFFQVPGQKPVTLAGRAISDTTQEAEIVVDVCAGSGTTMVAGHQLDRQVYALESDPMLCQVHIARMQALDPTLVITINGKEVSNG